MRKRLTDYSRAGIQHELDERRYQAPKEYKAKQIARQHRYREKRNPMSKQDMDAFWSFVQSNFAPKYQFPMLVTLFSMRLDEFYMDDIAESIALYTGKHHAQLDSLQYPPPISGD